MPHDNRLLPWNIKKKRGSQNYCLSRILGLRIAHHLRISNAEAPAIRYTNKSVYTKQRDVKPCFTKRTIRICEIQYAADKTSVQRLSIMFAASFHWNSVAKLGIIWLLQPKNHPKEEKRPNFHYFCRVIQTLLKNEQTHRFLIGTHRVHILWNNPLQYGCQNC